MKFPQTRNSFTSKILARGFTLIELLVVVAIIAMLASIVMASLNSTRARARDSTRLADMRQIETALELYATNNSGKYPSTSNAWRAGSSACHATYGSGNPGYGATGYIPGLVPQYIPELPEDPNGVFANKCYLYYSNGTDYMFLVWLTVETAPTLASNPRPRLVTDGLSSTCGDANGYQATFSQYSSQISQCW